MDGHSAAPVRSRNSQSPSPSHSASASASSSVHHKRKFPGAPAPAAAAAAAAAAPFSLSDTGGLTSNDDLDSISAREEEDDTEEEEDEEEEDEEEEEEEDNDSMRTFTAARLEAPVGVSSSNPRSTKPPKAENPSTKVEPSGGGLSESGVKDERGAVGQSGQQNGASAANLMPGIVVKEDTVKGLFTENIQTSGAYSAREEGLKREVFL